MKNKINILYLLKERTFFYTFDTFTILTTLDNVVDSFVYEDKNFKLSYRGFTDKYVISIETEWDTIMEMIPHLTKALTAKLEDSSKKKSKVLTYLDKTIGRINLNMDIMDKNFLVNLSVSFDNHKDKLYDSNIFIIMQRNKDNSLMSKKPIFVHKKYKEDPNDHKPFKCNEYDFFKAKGYSNKTIISMDIQNKLANTNALYIKIRETLNTDNDIINSHELTLIQDILTQYFILEQIVELRKKQKTR